MRLTSLPEGLATMTGASCYGPSKRLISLDKGSSSTPLEARIMGNMRDYTYGPSGRRSAQDLPNMTYHLGVQFKKRKDHIWVFSQSQWLASFILTLSIKDVESLR